MATDYSKLAAELTPYLAPYFLRLGTGYQDITAWTPTYYGSTAAGVTTYTTQAGLYVRIGSLVIAQGYVVWSAVTGTGNARLGLPLTAVNTSNIFYPVSLWYASVTYTNAVLGLIRPNTAQFELWTSTGSNAASSQIGIEAAGEVAFVATYFV